jgi:hypothetical protein
VRWPFYHVTQVSQVVPVRIEYTVCQILKLVGMYSTYNLFTGTAQCASEAGTVSFLFTHLHMARRKRDSIHFVNMVL